MYCIEKGNEGKFIRRSEMHTQLVAWEEMNARASTQLTKAKKELLEVAQQLQSANSGLKNMSNHAMALETAIRSVAVREKQKVGELECELGREKKKRRIGQSKYDTVKAAAEASRAEASSTLASFEASAETNRLLLLESEKNVEDCKIIHQEKERALRAINTK